MLALAMNDVRISFPGLAAPVLTIDSLDIHAQARVVVTGASGSGKTTLINLITGLSRPDAGRIAWNGTDIARLGEGRRDRWRAENIGMVMQDFHLFPGLSARDNVLLPARLACAATPKSLARADDLIQRVGLSRPDQPVETMSRGEMQRVAVARALLREPGVVIADEPTASLDETAGDMVCDLLFEFAATGRTLIVVSHDPRLIARADRKIVLAKGCVAADSGTGETP